MPKKLTQEDVIERFRMIHGNKYDYGELNYKNKRTPFTVICHKKDKYGNEHGAWSTTLDIHSSGCGCPKCALERRRTTNEEYIEKCKKVWGDRYILDAVDYFNDNTKVTIICRIHGPFQVRPGLFIHGCGCRECRNEYLRKIQAMTTEEFIRRAKEVHLNKDYDYSRVEYVNLRTNVIIGCPKHGWFEQNAAAHLRGEGCPYCKTSKGEDAVAQWLITHNVNHIRQYRVNMPLVLFGRNRIIVDFYLPDCNTIIEYNGAQHYVHIPKWHTLERFQDQQDRDRRLREYCKQHGITLIEIPYTKIKEIDKILDKKIGKSK